MKCSELIQHLNDYIEEHGDDEVELMYTIEFDDEAEEVIELADHVSESAYTDENEKECHTFLICTNSIM